jgi:hypothetical protein
MAKKGWYQKAIWQGGTYEGESKADDIHNGDEGFVIENPKKPDQWLFLRNGGTWECFEHDFRLVLNPVENQKRLDAMVEKCRKT